MEKKQALKEILKVLPKLSKRELDDLKTRVSFLSNGLNKDTSTTKEELLYQEINNMISWKTNSKKIPFLAVKKTHLKNLKIAVKFIDEYIISTNLKLTNIKRQRLYWLFSKLTATFLERCSVPISITSILNNHQKLPSLLDDAFPSYAINNCLDLAFRQEKK